MDARWKNEGRKRGFVGKWLKLFLLISVLFLVLNQNPAQHLAATDEEGPKITILSPQNTTYTSTSVPLIVTVNKEFSWMGYSLDFGENITIVENVTLTGLAEGEHNVIVFANDTSGNMGASERVYFLISPIHDVAITSISLPYTQICSGEIVEINVTVENKGTVPESFNVSIYYNDALIETKKVGNLAENENKTLIYYWNTTEVPIGTHSIKAETSTVPGESNATNNILIFGQVFIYPKPIVQIKPSLLEFKVEKDFEIGVWIANVTKLYHFEFTLCYDPSLLYISEVYVCDEYGMFLKGPYSGGVIHNDATKGKLYISLTQSSGATPVNGSGQLAQIKIKIVKTIVYSWKPGSINFLACQLNLTELKIGIKLEMSRFLDPNEGELSVSEAEYIFKPVPGDLNLDGITDVTDLSACAKKFGFSGETIFDVDGNNVVDWNDLVLIGKNIGRTKP